MYFLRVEAKFSAALYLSNCGDKYKGMHGHDYSVCVVLKSTKLNQSGVVYDYEVLQHQLTAITEKFDNVLLNDMNEFLEDNPSVENLAHIFSSILLEKLPDLPLYEVSVSEARGFCGTFRPVTNVQ